MFPHYASLINILRIWNHNLMSKPQPNTYIPISPYNKQKPELTGFTIKYPYGQK